MRISPPEIKVEHVVVSQTDFQADWKRGFCYLERVPETEEVITDRRSGKSVTITHKQQIVFRCMRCQFDVLDSELAPVGGKPRTAKDVIDEHIRVGRHPWTYTMFTNPYGRDGDVSIEGITNYSAEIGGLE